MNSTIWHEILFALWGLNLPFKQFTMLFLMSPWGKKNVNLIYLLIKIFFDFRIFQNGGITWGRIAALLTFGYRLILACFRIGYRFLNVSEVIQVVTKFIVTGQIAKWIARCGGWVRIFFSVVKLNFLDLKNFLFSDCGIKLHYE